MKSKLWLIFALVTTIFWGVWGAFIEITEQAGFPATLGYVVWSLTMIPPALVALKLIDWQLDVDVRSIVLGSAVGFLGAGGQLVLFHVLGIGPAYIIFPIIALSPVVTVLLSIVILKERTNAKGWLGDVFALLSIPLMCYQPPESTVASVCRLPDRHPTPLLSAYRAVCACRAPVACSRPAGSPCMGSTKLCHEVCQRDHEGREHLLLHGPPRSAALPVCTLDDRLLTRDQLGLSGSIPRLYDSDSECDRCALPGLRLSLR